MSTIELILARQAADRDAFDAALAALHAADISADVIDAVDCKGRRVPPWAKPEAGGFFLRMQRDRLAQGQVLIEPYLGKAPA